MTLGLKPLWKCNIWNKYLGKTKSQKCETFLSGTKLVVEMYWYLESEFENATKGGLWREDEEENLWRGGVSEEWHALKF